MVDREIIRGYCGAPDNMVIARYSRHMWEEPVISGDVGSGTIFFSYCNLRCCFCQNYEISELHRGRDVSVSEFADICLELEGALVNNINLVSPTIYADKIVMGLSMARAKGLSIPIVYNTSGYDNVDTIKMLDGYIDIYLPDLKYYSDEYAIKYSGVSNYFSMASRAIDEMYHQVGAPVIENGIMKKGVIVRHLVIPGLEAEAKKIIKYLYFKYHDNIFISIMSQYTPVVLSERFPELNRKITDREYEKVVSYISEKGFENVFVQEGEAAAESFSQIAANIGVSRIPSYSGAARSLRKHAAELFSSSKEASPFPIPRNRRDVFTGNPFSTPSTNASA